MEGDYRLYYTDRAVGFDWYGMGVFQGQRKEGFREWETVDGDGFDKLLSLMRITWAWRHR